MNQKIIFSVFFLSSLSLIANAELTLEKGTEHRDKVNFPQEYKFKIWDLEDVAASNGAKNLDSIISYVPIESEEVKFVLDRDISVAQIDLGNKLILGNWPLTRWEHLKAPPEIGIENKEVRYSGTQSVNMGCFNSTPLRYGDIEGDGISEIVLTLDSELIVFSPKVGKTVFAMFMDASDWWTFGEEAYLEMYIEDNGSRPPEEDLYHGYSSQYTDYIGRGNFYAGHRAYSKMYVHDFDEDGKDDIVKWEKVYKSNKKIESPAWTRLRSELTFYKKSDTGEYVPQTDTKQNTIQGWLESNNLTWQQGFPSKSECKGQEGELIPEMHDPLLNDPEVLK